MDHCPRPTRPPPERPLKAVLNLGAVPTALPIVSQLTGPFHARFPNVFLTVLSQTSQEIQNGIDDFELDVGMTYLDNEPLENVLTKPIYREEYVFLTPAANCPDTAGAVPQGMRLIKVSTLGGAMSALETLAAGGQVPSC